MAAVTAVGTWHDALVGEYRIDDLARAAGTSVRNVRAYQEKGLLEPPARVGRTAIYGDAHLARLRLILQLLERGATLQLIADLVDAWHDGQDIADLLGLESALLAPAADEVTDAMSLDDLGGLFGADPDPNDVERAVELGILRPDEGRYRVIAPRLVQVGTDLAQMGVPVAEMLEHVGGLRARMESVAHDFVDLAVHHLFRDLIEDVERADLGEAATLIQRLRPLARSVVDIELARALDDEIAGRIAQVLVDDRSSEDGGAGAATRTRS